MHHVTYSFPKIVLCPYSTVKQGYENKDKHPHTIYYSFILYVMFFSLISFFFFSHYSCVDNFTLYTLSYNFTLQYYNHHSKQHNKIPSLHHHNMVQYNNTQFHLPYYYYILAYIRSYTNLNLTISASTTDTTNS